MQKSHLTTEEFCCRWAPTLGALEATHQEIWKTKDYQPFGLRIPKLGIEEISDQDKPTVFFGLYGLPDFMMLWAHKGARYILWAGTDIQHFLKGYWLDPEGKMRVKAIDLAPWLDTFCYNFVENDKEKAALASVGIRAKVVPSFLGDVTKFEVSYHHNPRPQLYTSVSGDNFELYGWDKLPALARENPGIDFHLYGTNDHEGVMKLLGHPEKNYSNIINHTRVPKEQMNEEIKAMQGALRLTEFDGFSEILAKSVLMGQWPVSVIEYPHILKLSEIAEIHEKKQPNIEGRKYYLETLNKYPWNHA